MALFMASLIHKTHSMRNLKENLFMIKIKLKIKIRFENT